jgi:hypothetical protein
MFRQKKIFILLSCFFIFIIVTCSSSGIVPMSEINNFEPMPEGDNGLAAKYPGDIGIENDPNVILADNFESYTTLQDITQKWSGYFNDGSGYNLRITSDKDKIYSGNNAIEFKMPLRSDPLSVGVFKWLDEEQDIIFIRYYKKIDESFNLIDSFHNGITISSYYYQSNGQATPGVAANGYNKFLVSYENFRGSFNEKSPGRQNVYVYHPQQRDVYGDHLFPGGDVLPISSKRGEYGQSFISRPDFIPVLGQWYCYEIMVKANTPGKRDGRITCWVDGEIIADFTNFRLRDTNKLLINRIDMGIYAATNPHSETAQYFDNIVIAKSYIGPLFVVKD